MQKYETLYQRERNALGAPSRHMQAFFKSRVPGGARVLDAGCGQGRDALYIARLGFSVVAVDTAATGIAQIREEAEHEGLDITAVVADISSYKPEGEFDVVLFDHALACMARDQRLKALRNYMGLLKNGGLLLIAEDKSTLPDLRQITKAAKYDVIKDKNGFLFLQKPE